MWKPGQLVTIEGTVYRLKRKRWLGFVSCEICEYMSNGHSFTEPCKTCINSKDMPENCFLTSVKQPERKKIQLVTTDNKVYRLKKTKFNHSCIYCNYSKVDPEEEPCFTCQLNSVITYGCVLIEVKPKRTMGKVCTK